MYNCIERRGVRLLRMCFLPANKFNKEGEFYEERRFKGLSTYV